MDQKKFILIALTAVFLVFLIFLFLDMHSKGIPFPVYLKYLEYKLKYNCGNECFQKIEVCSIVNLDEKDYIVGGGYKGGYGIDIHFFSNGTEICDFGWAIDMRDAYGDYYKKAGCPPIKECKVLQS